MLQTLNQTQRLVSKCCWLCFAFTTLLTADCYAIQEDVNFNNSIVILCSENVSNIMFLRNNQTDNRLSLENEFNLIDQYYLNETNEIEINPICCSFKFLNAIINSDQNLCVQNYANTTEVHLYLSKANTISMSTTTSTTTTNNKLWSTYGRTNERCHSEAFDLCSNQNENEVQHALNAVTFNDQELDTSNAVCDERADINFDRNHSKTIEIFIEFAPIILKPVIDTTIEVDSSLVTMYCLIQSSPKPSIEWLKNDQNMYSLNISHLFMTSTKQVNECLFNTSLTMRLRTYALTGNYTCLTANKYGHSKINFEIKRELIEKFMPTPPPFNINGFILGMVPPLLIAFYIILKLGYRSRYAMDRTEEEEV